MKQESQKENSRRKFLSLGLFKSAELKTSGIAVEDTPIESNETIPVLTADGKLVQISKAVMEKIKREKATNRDIINWSESLKNSMLP